MPEHQLSLVGGEIIIPAFMLLIVYTHMRLHTLDALSFLFGYHLTVATQIAQIPLISFHDEGDGQGDLSLVHKAEECR